MGCGTEVVWDMSESENTRWSRTRRQGGRPESSGRTGIMVRMEFNKKKGGYAGEGSRN